MIQPLVSVVIPSYKGEVFLERTLRSALAQTHTNLEVIVVNDGSPDRTGVIADAVAGQDRRVQVLHVPNGGVAKARNLGVEHATGDYIAFLDHDDLWHPTKLELQLALLRKGNAGAVYTLMRLIDSEDRVVANHVPAIFQGYSFVRHLYERPVGNGSGVLARREAVVAVGGFDGRYEGCEDFDLELKLAARYPMAVVPLHLVGYRVSPENMSNTRRVRMAQSALATVEHQLETHPEIPQRARRLALAATLTYAVNNMIADHQRALVPLYFARLARADARHAMHLAATTCAGKFTRTAAALRQTVPSTNLQHFYEYSPELDHTCTMDRRKRMYMDELAIIDAELGARLGYGS